jgi:hypothetical protein
MSDKERTQIVMVGGKKVIAHDVTTVRAARSGDYPPMIVSLPKKIVDAMKLNKGETLNLY